MLTFLVGFVPLDAAAQAADCASMFVGGVPPTLTNPKLALRATMLCNEGYAVLASGVTRGALWSAEYLTGYGLAQARATPNRGSFHLDPRLPAGDGAHLEDYRNSGFDRGHMTPSGDMPTATARQESFSLANMVPQTAALNRGVWAKIEAAVRRMALRRGELYVVTGPAFEGDRLVKIGDNGVLVPTSTWKAVYDPKAGRAGAYWCTNTDQPTCMVVAVSSVQQLAGVDPFPSLPLEAKNAVIPLPGPLDLREH